MISQNFIETETILASKRKNELVSLYYLLQNKDFYISESQGLSIPDNSANSLFTIRNQSIMNPAISSLAPWP